MTNRKVSSASEEQSLVFHRSLYEQNSFCEIIIKCKYFLSELSVENVLPLTVVHQSQEILRNVKLNRCQSRIKKESVVAYFKVFLGICPEFKKTMAILSEDSW